MCVSDSESNSTTSSSSKSSSSACSSCQSSSSSEGDSGGGGGGGGADGVCPARRFSAGRGAAEVLEAGPEGAPLGAPGAAPLGARGGGVGGFAGGFAIFRAHFGAAAGFGAPLGAPTAAPPGAEGACCLVALATLAASTCCHAEEPRSSLAAEPLLVSSEASRLSNPWRTPKILSRVPLSGAARAAPGAGSAAEEPWKLLSG